MLNEKGRGCLVTLVTAVILWYIIILLFANIRVLLGCFVGLAIAVLGLYSVLKQEKERPYKAKIIGSYIAGVVVAMLINCFLPINLWLLISSSVIIVLIAPIVAWVNEEIKR